MDSFGGGGVRMAICPKCNGAMGQTQAVCPHCGYDFPQPAEPRSMPWWLHLGFAVAAVAVLIVFEDNPVVWVVSQLMLLAAWVSLFLGAWRVTRDE